MYFLIKSSEHSLTGLIFTRVVSMEGPLQCKLTWTLVLTKIEICGHLVSWQHGSLNAAKMNGECGGPLNQKQQPQFRFLHHGCCFWFKAPPHSRHSAESWRHAAAVWISSRGLFLQAPRPARWSLRESSPEVTEQRVGMSQEEWSDLPEGKSPIKLGRSIVWLMGDKSWRSQSDGEAVLPEDQTSDFKKKIWRVFFCGPSGDDEDSVMLFYGK